MKKPKPKKIKSDPFGDTPESIRNALAQKVPVTASYIHEQSKLVDGKIIDAMLEGFLAAIPAPVFFLLSAGKWKIDITEITDE